MKFDCEVWITLEPRMKNGKVAGVKVANMYKRPTEGSIRLSISVPENFFRTPTIRLDLPERDEEIWTAHPIEMPGAESGGGK